MRAKFIGKDCSRGFRNGKIYKIRTEVLKEMLIVFDTNSVLSCPYSKLETMLDNWEIVTNDREERDNNMKLINPEVTFSKNKAGQTLMNLTFQRTNGKIVETTNIPYILLDEIQIESEAAIVKGYNTEAVPQLLWDSPTSIRLPVLGDQKGKYCTVKQEPIELTMAELKKRLGYPFRIKGEK